RLRCVLARLTGGGLRRPVMVDGIARVVSHGFLLRSDSLRERSDELPAFASQKTALQLAAPSSRCGVTAGWQHGHGDVGRDCGQWIYRLRVRAAPGPPPAQN